jgi:hypothetical protein
MDVTVPPDYHERVYAGVLGKIIGVYLGRPFEGWTYEQIIANLGEIKYYVRPSDLPLRNHNDHHRRYLRHIYSPLADYNNSLDLTPAQRQDVAQLHRRKSNDPGWGGLGNSTEHTAFLRLKQGIPAPDSGSSTRNGKVVAEQIKGGSHR